LINKLLRVDIKMKITTYHIDAFTDKIFTGNPAVVCVMDKWLPDALLQQLAAENNQPATAFLVREAEKYSIRWFGPEYEIDLCGHGTLAAAYVVFNILKPASQEIMLVHPAVGQLHVKRANDLIVLDLPVKDFSPSPASHLLEEGLGIKPEEIYEFKKERVLVILKTETEVKKLAPDIQLLKQLEHRGIIVTAPGETADFVSRVFYPKKNIFEDAVTGSSYCLLVPYWSKRLKQNKFHASQLSQRGGTVFCELVNNRVYLSGKAVLYKQGEIMGDF
jgi:PhzF family phenazine biosynthesis protein